MAASPGARPPVTPLLSIIIVAYRSRDELGPCLASLPRALAGAPVEVIVVDNSPDDGAGEMVRRDFPWVRYLAADENLGFGRANNLGYRQAAGDFILFLNPDTVANEPALEHLVRRLQAEPDIGLLSPQLVQADGTMDLACRRSIPTLWDGFCRASGLAAAFPRRRRFAGYNLTYLPADGTHDVGAINGAFMLTRRAVLESVAEPTAAVQGILQEKTERTEGGDTKQTQLSVSSVASCEKRAAVRDSGPECRGPSQEHAEQAEESSDRANCRGPEATGGKSSASSAASCERETHTQIFDERFFMYGDDLDLCIRVARAGWRIVYDGRVRIVHLKGVSVAKDYERMARAIFDANRDVYLKHFNPRGSRLVRWKFRLAFGLWKTIALLRARLRGRRRVRPL